MSRKRTNSKTIAKGAVALLVAGVLTAGVCCMGYAARGDDGKWFGNGNVSTWHWKDKADANNPEDNPPENPPIADSWGGAFMSDIESSGISLLSAKLPRAAYAANGVSEEADTAFTLTASVEPIGATDYFDWTISNNEDEALTLTVSSDRASAVVTCLKAFGTQKVISVTSSVNPAITATCTVDYYKRIQDVTFEMSTIALQLTETEYTITPIVNYGVGTVEDSTVTVTGGTIRLNQNVKAINYQNYGSKAELSEDVMFTGNTFSLVMSPDGRPSFCNVSTGGPANAMYAGIFKNFVSQISNPNSIVNSYAKGKHYSIELSWTATRNGETLDSGTYTLYGEFDVSALTVAASGITLNQTGVVI